MTYKINYKRLALLLLLAFGLLGGIGYGLMLWLSGESASEPVPQGDFVPPVAQNLNGAPLRENRSIYANDQDGHLEHLYVTVLPDENPADEFSAFDKLQAYTLDSGMEKPMAQVIFQQGDASGPRNSVSSEYGQKVNGVIETRGRSTSNTIVKSFKISLADEGGLWMGQKVINLNKHPYDQTRMRNKLSFDYFETMPDMVSLRTQFVSLHIKDLSKGPDAAFEDFGLFTHVEQVNKRYLRMHGLDDSGNLYKAASFEFYRYPETLKLKDDPSYDAAAFNQILEIKGSEDHRALIQMLEKLNDLTVDVDQVIEDHFNRENYLTWLATNIIFGNMDTISQNFYLYRPTASETWYFIPWDYDGAWGGRDQNEAEAAQYSLWQNGISNLWGSELNRRFLKKDENRAALEAKIKEVLSQTTEARTEAMLKTYYPVVSEMVAKEPDLTNLRTDMNGFAEQIKRVIRQPRENYEAYMKSLENPMPVFLWRNEQLGKESVFEWEASYDFQKDEIFYDLTIAATPDMAKPLYELKSLKNTEAKIPALPKGTYYWKLVIRDAKGNVMLPFDSYTSPTRVVYHGVRQYRVE